MSKRTYPIAIYPIRTISKEFNSPPVNEPLALSVKDLEESFALTPKMPTEENFPLFTITLTKEIFETNSKEILVKLSREYTYRLDIEDSISPEPEHLFEKLNESIADFAQHYFKLTNETRYHSHSQIKMINKEEHLTELARRIDFWEDSIRHIKVDNDGKPLDRN